MAKNAPDRFDSYLLKDDEKLLEVQEDTKISHAATFRVAKQDHTLANMMRSQLLKNPAVLFAGYKVPHPLEPYFILKIQTNGSISPNDVLKLACEDLIAMIQELKGKFDKEFDMKSFDIGLTQLGGGRGVGAEYQYGGGVGRDSFIDGWVGDARNRGANDYVDFGV